MRLFLLSMCAVALIAGTGCNGEGSEGPCGLEGPPDRDSVQENNAGLDAQGRPALALAARETGKCEGIQHYELSFDAGTFALREIDDDEIGDLDSTSVVQDETPGEIAFDSGAKIIADWTEQPVALHFLRGNEVIDVVCESKAGAIHCE